LSWIFYSYFLKLSLTPIKEEEEEEEEEEDDDDDDDLH
jgi:hypothetical protein